MKLPHKTSVKLSGWRAEGLTLVRVRKVIHVICRVTRCGTKEDSSEPQSASDASHEDVKRLRLRLKPADKKKTQKHEKETRHGTDKQGQLAGRPQRESVQTQTGKLNTQQPTDKCGPSNRPDLNLSSRIPGQPDVAEVEEADRPRVALGPTLSSSVFLPAQNHPPAS